MEKTLLYFIVVLLFLQLPTPAYAGLEIANACVIIYCTFRMFIDVVNTFIDRMTYVIDAVLDKKEAEKKENNK